MTAHLEIALVLGVMFEGSGVPGLGAPTAPQPGTAVPSPAGPVLDREAESVGIRAVVEEVLARPEFADLHADPNAFGRWLMEWIGWLFKRLGSAIEGLPSGVLWSIVASMLLALLAILAHLIYTLWSILGGAKRLSLPGSAARRHPGELLGVRDLDFDTLYVEAQRLLAAGDWLPATKYLYVVAILWLDRQGWIAFRPPKTNRDYLRELRSKSQLQGLFHRLTEGFESIVYGGQSATTSTTRDMADTVESLLHEPVRAVAS
ncbi:MAG: DUF4129 domain-containing protein [Thermoguttaceae bacterium]